MEHEDDKLDLSDSQPVVTVSSLSSMFSSKSDSKLKSLMRDELLINVQKFATQVLYNQATSNIPIFS